VCQVIKEEMEKRPGNRKMPEKVSEQILKIA
jgi:hypothetical protein